MFLLVLLLQLSRPPTLIIFSDLCTDSSHRNTLSTTLFPPHISSSSCLLHVIFAISSQYSLLNPLDMVTGHWSVSSNHQITPISISQTALSGMLHLTCRTRFLLLLVHYQSGISSSPSSYLPVIRL